MLTGAVRGVHGSGRYSSLQRTDHGTGDVQAVGGVAAGTQVGGQFHRLLLVQREVPRHSRSSVSLRGSRPPLLSSAVERRRQLQQRRHADNCRSHRQRMTTTPGVGRTRWS